MCHEALHLFFDGALTFTIIDGLHILAGTRNQIGGKETAGRVNTQLQFVQRFDSKQMDNARHELATEISLQQPTVSEILEFFEELGIAWNEDCIDKKLTHSAFSYDAQHWWALVKKPYVDKLRTENGEEFYCEFEKMLTSVRMMFPGTQE